MTLGLALALFASVPTSGRPAPAAARLAELLRPFLPPGAKLSKVVPSRPLPASCALAHVLPTRPLQASARVAVRLEGHGCPLWTWAEVEIERPAPAPAESAPAGTQIRVVVRAGALSIAETGRVVPCIRDATCAVLPSGRHVEGHLEAGSLLVEVP